MGRKWRKRKQEIAAEISGLQSGLKWGRTEYRKVLANSTEEALAIADEYVSRMYAASPWLSARWVPLGAEFAGVDMPEQIAADGKLIFSVVLRFEDVEQDKFTTA